MHCLQHEATLSVFILSSFGLLRQSLGFDFSRRSFVLQFCCRQVAQQLTNRSISRSRGSKLVESSGILLHLPRMLPYGFNSLQTNLPELLSLHEAANVLPSDKRYVISEF